MIKGKFREKRQEILLILILMVLTVLMGICFPRVFVSNITNHTTLGQFALGNNEAREQESNKEFIYLSDLEYITANNWSYNGWSGHAIQKDKNPEGNEIKLKVDGQIRTYLKGMGLHAKGQLTYKIEDLSNTYTRFTAKIGLDASRTVSSNIHFQILVSSDGENWVLLQKTNNITPGQEAIDVNLDVTGQKYLRIYVDPNGANTADHGVIANAKLTIEGYVEEPFVNYDKLKDLSYYDNILSSSGYDYNSETAHRLIMEREFVRKIGYEKINLLANFDKKTKETLDWIANNTRVLEECVEVGEIANTTTFLNVIQDLYQFYKEELQTENGDVYEKMIIGMAATYGTKVSSPLTFNHKTASYDYMERFALIKELYDKELMLYHKGWKTYHVEFFRYLMNDGTRNDELKWMNYIGKAKKYSTGVYSYVQYVKPNYSMSARPYLYDIANKEKYEAKWHLEEYGVPFADATTRYWMVMDAGGICWNQARTTKSAIIGMGRPSISVYQPDHESALFYGAENSDGTGKGSWGIAGNIFGWGKTANTWYGGNRTRTLFGWSSKSFTNSHIYGNSYGDSAGYVYLAQANLNNYADYKASLYLNLLANSFTNQEDKLKLYNEALKVNSINLDSYDYKIQMYKALNKTSEEWHTLALDIIDNYTFYPMAMGDLIKLVKPYLNGVDRVDIDQKYYDALLRAKKATVSDIWQTSAAQQIASARLGSANNKLASFSFDGANAGKIVLHKDYDTFTDLMWKYSLDGGVTKSEGTISHSLELSKEEIEKINDIDDIKIYIVGLNEANPTYTIDIVKGTISDTLYGNDLENRVVGVGLTYEWRHSEDEEWTSYATASPDNIGDKTLYVRNGAVGNALPSEVVKFTFTEDNQPETRQYITVAQVSIEEYYTQSKDSKRPFYAPNAIDGNIHTMWHTDFALDVRNDKEKKPFLTFKLENPKYISAVEFIQMQYKVEDYIQNARVYISEDNKNWKLAGQIENCPKNIGLRVIDFEESIYGQYVKLEMDTYSMFANIAMVNIFKDVTKQTIVVPTAAIGYDIETKTNKDVLARLRSSSEPVTITNNDGSDTYIFKENGHFTFEFENAAGVKGTATATVDWIDKEAPTAEIEYSTTFKTNKSVIATLQPSEEVIVTNNGDFNIDEDGNIYDRDGKKLEGYTVDDKANIIDENGSIITNINTFTYEFYDNAEFTFQFMDLAGNRGTKTAKVDWIDTTAPIGTLFYDKTGTTDKNVTVSIEFDEDAIITNNNGRNTYTFTENGEFTFEYKDLAGNTNSTTAKVDWIKKEVALPNIRLAFSEENSTKNSVTVMLINQGGPIKILNNNGSNMYTFTKNGEFTFEYEDLAGNKGTITAKVDWILEENNNNNDNNNNPSTTTTNPNNSSSLNTWTATTNTKKPTASINNVTTNVPSSIKEDPTTNDEIKSETNNKNVENKEQEETKTEDKNQKQEEIKEKSSKQENKSKKAKIALIGSMSFVAGVSLLRYKIKKRKRRF